MALLAFPAHADVSGPVCVTDGDTLVHGLTRVMHLDGLQAGRLERFDDHRRRWPLGNAQSGLTGQSEPSVFIVSGREET